MKILQLCYKPPFPPVDGGTMAMDSITQGLLEGDHQVKVLSVESDKHPVRLDAMGEDYRRATNFESVYIDLAIHPLDAAIALLCGESYNIKRFISNNFDSKLKSILDKEDFDIVDVESIFLTPYVATIRRHSNARIVLRAHNIEHRIWRQMAEGERRPLKRWYLKKLALALRVYELDHFGDYDGIACISDADAETVRELSCRKPIADIPFGIEVKPLPNVIPDPNSLFHIGSMDWMPNREAIKWFLDNAWPLIHSRSPQAHLFLAGRKMPAELLESNLEGVTVVGEVDDAAEFIASKAVSIVPLLSGSGIRIKIIEAMAMAKTVIATSVGAAGIDYDDGHNILIANTPEDFAKQVQLCIEHPELCRQIGNNARTLAIEKYSRQAITKRLVDFYNKISNIAL